MPIVSTDIQFRLSTKSGSAGDTTTSTPSASLGKYVSTTQMATGANNLFDNISGSENIAQATDYRCVFVLNNHATLTLEASNIYVTNVAGGADVTIGIDPAAASAKGSATAQATSIASESAAPSGVTFSAPAQGSELVLGDIGPGQVRAVWVKRTATNSAAINADGITLHVSGDTAA